MPEPIGSSLEVMMFFTIEKIENQLREIRRAIHRETLEIPQFKFFEGECAGAESLDFNDAQWDEFKTGEYWGGYDVVAWFRVWITIPKDWKGRKLALRFLVGPRDGGNSTAETLLYVNGIPLQGIDVWHEEAWLPPELAARGEILVALKAWSGVLKVPDRRHFKLAQLVWIDEGVERFFYQADTLLKTIKLLDENDLRRAKLLDLLNQSFHCIDFLRPGSENFYASLAAAGRDLEAGLARLELPELKPHIVGVGHSHIDMAWLWRLKHTREKAARTFSTVLNLMRQYPEYRFVHSSPQLYKFLKEDYPDIYAEVKRKIASGEWEITGGMWIEADTNLTCGESLVRQFLLGKQFAHDEFGVDMKVLWLPDVFGYSGALPQLIKKSGLKYFLTTKISWNQFNRFPYDTFYWRGIDGSEVLTHFVTTPEENSRIYTYNGQLSPADAKGIWDNYRQKEVNDELLLLFGWGDGGGGPTKEMLEYARGMRNLPGMPEVSLDKAEPYFERLERRVSGKELPLWDGELYLEFHRGTYTSQAQIKRSNRKAEILYHNAEWLSALADLSTGQSDYPAQELHSGWEMILLNQFHDILPGSSIRQVYEDCRKDYCKINRIGEEALDRAKKSLADQLAAGPESLVVFNSLSWTRGGLVELPWSEELAAKRLQSPAGQVVELEGERKVLFEVLDVPALGYQAYPLVQEESLGERLAAAGAGAMENSPVPSKGNGRGPKTNPAEDEAYSLTGTAAENSFQITDKALENDFYAIRLNSRGQIISLWDKRSSREVLAPGERGNVFQLFEDKPMNFDAWDVDIYYQEKMREIDELVEAIVEENGPLRGTLCLTWRFGDSRITQRIRLYRRTARIDFITGVDWHEQQVLLKAAFPVDVRATRATYDIQFGNIERPTHWNTSWDYARFETAGHKWVDLSEGNYGVALLNDCKYGHDVKDHTLRLTLIKSAVDPDPQADQGEHHFTYSLLPHTGDWRKGEVVKEAYDLNVPLLFEAVPARDQGRLPLSCQFVEIDAEHVILETVKKAEGDEAWIVRVYEYQQCRSNEVHLDFGQPIQKAAECNLVEEDEQPVFFEGQRLTFSIAPYEIKTFKIWF